MRPAVRSRRPRVTLVALALACGVALTITALTVPAVGGQRRVIREFRGIGRTITTTKALSTRLARTDRSLLRLRGDEPVQVLVKLDYDAVASYQGGVAGLPATSPAATGVSMRRNATAVRRYTRYVAGRERRAVAAIRAAVPTAAVYGRFRLAYGGVAVRVPADRIRTLLRLPGVVAVQKDALAQPQTSVTPEFLGAPRVWQRLGGQGIAGQNVIVGVLDTGVWPEHPGFRDRGIGPAAGDFRCEFGGGARLGPDFACNDKLVGAYAKLRTYMRFIGALPGEFCNNRTRECSARDAEGHGTHTSTTAAGSLVEHAPMYGIDRGPISGVAPGAHVIMYRVCLFEGCFFSDSIRAVQRAILDGVDVINFSIGGGSDPYEDAVELAFLDAYAAGISVNASAGNAGPGPATAEHGGPWVTTVGASTSPRWFMTTLRLAARGGETLRIRGATITRGIRSTRVVLAQRLPGYDDPTCSTRLPKGAAEGLIVACERTPGRVLKSFRVRRAGGVGMILYNVRNEDLFTDSHFVPSVHIEGPRQSSRFLAFMRNPGVTASWRTGEPTAIRPDVMTVFSSRGPLGDFIKPDVTAPGIQILAGDTPQGATPDSGVDGQLFQAIAGTSMSSPHAAGVSALVKAVHPDWTPGQVKSALMTSAVQDVLEQDGRTPADPFDAGAGSIRASRAVDPTLTFDESPAAFARSGRDRLGRIHLNLPSIDAPVMPGAITTTRVAKNVTGESVSFEASTDSTDGMIRVSPRRFTLAPGESQRLDITIDGTDAARGQHFGHIRLAAGGGHTDVVLPVAFVRTQGEVRLHHTCNRRNIQLGGGARCEAVVRNKSFAETGAFLAVRGPSPRELEITDVTRPGEKAGNGFTASGTLAGAIAPPIEAVEPGAIGPSYVPLAGLGAEPIEGMSDESIANFAVPTYLYGHQRYDEIGLTSNGYAVVGGGEASDVVFVPQDIPDPAVPNNVLAPFWTDLDPGAGGNMYLAIVEDGQNRWLVSEWDDVPTFGDPDERHSFQIWILLGGEETIAYVYGRMTGAGDESVGLTVGAENSNGTSAATASGVPREGDELVVRTGFPTPGGELNVGYRVIGHARGEYDLVASMRSDLTPGITRRVERVNVLTIP